MRKKVVLPRTKMPVPAINIEAEGGTFFVGADESFVTSAYCDHDEVQWLYYRQVTRGFSDSELMTCDMCGRKLFVNEIRGHYMSSTTTPEVVGWIRLAPGRTLELALSESSCEMLGDALLEDIRRLDFSGSILKVNLYQTSYVSPNRRRPEKSELLSSLKLIASRRVLKPRKQKSPSAELQRRKDDLSESPLRPDPRLIAQSREQTKRFLKNPPAKAFKWSRSRSLKRESSDFSRSPKTSKQSPVKRPGPLSRWTHLAKASSRTQ